jgi:hypothetical protein
MNRLVDVFSRFAGKYLLKFRDEMRVGHLKALANFSQCRTEVYGKFTSACTGCGLVEESHGACRNRACPKCNSVGTAEWIAKAKARLPNTSYYHMVFTVPSELRPIAHRHPKVFYEKLMAAVGETLTAFSDSEKWVMGQTGFITFLHTWDSQLRLHPHVHVLAMGGYLNSAGEWVAVSRKELFPTHALSSRFRTTFLKSLRAVLNENIPSRFWKLAWVVYMKEVFPGTRDVIEYLGRYVKKIGIGASRLTRVDKHGVILQYRHRLGKDSHEMRNLHLSGEEFMGRYLQHVLPKGFVRIRYLGLLHSHGADLLESVRAQVASTHEVCEKERPELRCLECRGEIVEIARVLPTFFRARKRKGGNSIYNREEKRSTESTGGTPPYNQLIEPTARGRHAFRVAKVAPVPSGPSLRGGPPAVLAAHQRVIRTLYRPLRQASPA